MCRTRRFSILLELEDRARSRVLLNESFGFFVSVFSSTRACYATSASLSAKPIQALPANAVLAITSFLVRL